MMDLKYSPLEYIKVNKPVDRVSYICGRVKGRRVLDLGCWDETALVKRGTHFWLHDEIAINASDTIGLDNSPNLPEAGIQLENSKILKGDITNERSISGFDVDVLVGGEVIEHLPNALNFLKQIKRAYPGKRAIFSTPNATGLSNVLLGVFNRESMHIDHLNIYSFKTLNTLCRLAGFNDYIIVPYHIRYTEMIIREKGVVKAGTRIMERIINVFEYLFPLLSGGYIVDVSI